MTMDWEKAESWIMGSAWIDSLVSNHINTLCDDIGVRWGGSEGEKQAAKYIISQFEKFGLDNIASEPFKLSTWECSSASIVIVGEEEKQIDVRPSLFCPEIVVTGPLVDVGYGMAHEIQGLGQDLTGAIALITGAYEPFSPPEPLTNRLERLTNLGVAAAITPYANGGRRTAHGSTNDWRDMQPGYTPLPTVHTSREDGSHLSRRATANNKVTVTVQAQQKEGKSLNNMGELIGNIWPKETLLLGAHYDTTPDSPGANDNGSGTTVLLETSRILSGLNKKVGISPGRTIKFVTFGSEEQGLQGSDAYVRKHFGEDPKPNLMINLDELGTGTMKGVALQFPELRFLVQRELDNMDEGLKCHVMAQMDASGDMYPFARNGIPSSMLWRWRFIGRHPDTGFGHSSSDTPDKVRTRELKEYSGLLARLLFRLSHVNPVDWPENKLDVNKIESRIQNERGSVVRTM